MDTILVGSGKSDITPPTGWPLQGFGPDYGFSTGIHDPLFARAVTLKNAVASAAIVAVDVCGMPLKDCRIASEAASVLTGIPAENIQICASHNHHAPSIANLFTANRAPSDEYLRQLTAGIVEAVRQASARAEPALAHSVRAELAMNLNRRVEMPDGTVKDLPWNMHLRPNGPVDRELIAIRFSDISEKRTIALLYNYASHAICLGEEIKETSADFPGAASALLESRFGGAALFLTQLSYLLA